jgi:hypothetical protein
MAALMHIEGRVYLHNLPGCRHNLFPLLALAPISCDRQFYHREHDFLRYY